MPSVREEEGHNSEIAKVLNQIDSDLLASNALRLIKEPSPTLREETASKLYCNMLKEYGLEAELMYVQQARPNVIGRIRGEGTGPSLLLGGHIDTIPDKACTPPRIEGGRVYGRGAIDMKGELVSMAAAAGAIKKSGVKLKGDLLIAAWVDHEDPDGRGMGPQEVARKIQTGELKVDGVIITEGPYDSIAIAQGGCLGFEIHVSGRRGGPHTLSCTLKANPVLWGSMVVDELYKMDQELESKKGHPLIAQRRQIQIGVFQAGDFYNRLPEDVKIVGTLRWDPGENFEDAARTLQERMNQLQSKIRNSLDPEGKIQLDLQLHRESSELNSDDRLVHILQEAVTKVFGHPLPLTGNRSVADQPYFLRGARVPALYYGPSTKDDTTGHSNNESVSLERLTTISKVYAASALLFCGYHLR